MTINLLYFLAGAGVMALLMVIFQFWIIKAVNNQVGPARVIRAKRQRQIDITPFHPRCREALDTWTQVEHSLDHGVHHSRFAHFRSETGKPAPAYGPSCYAYSIFGAITLAVFPEPVPQCDDSNIDRVWRGELQDLVVGLVWALMPAKYENVDDFSNFAPWAEIEHVLHQGRKVLESGK